MMAQNNERAASKRRRGPGRPYKKGESGNAGGRPRRAAHVQEMARKKTPEAIEALVVALQSPRERVQAACALLNFGWGKPVQMMLGDPERPIAVEFVWQDSSGGEGFSAPNAHTDTQSPRHIGQQIEAAIIEAVVADADETNDEQS